MKLRPLLAACAALILLATGFAVWYAVFRDARTALEIEYALINRSDLTDNSRTGGLYTISLIPANLRDEVSTARHPSGRLSGRVSFRLALMAPEAEGTEMEASIERSGSRIFTVPARVFRNAFGSELRFLAPRSVLVPGNYEIIASPPDSSKAKTVYQLRIE